MLHHSEWIEVHGAREHNLKGVDLKLPKRQLIVMTGPSGSGKSSMAFDTIFAEGRRRYLDSLSVYARQFIGEMRRPDVSELRGLGPAIAIDQKTAGHNPRSTVGTITEVLDFMRVLWSNVGVLAAGDAQGPGTQAAVDELLAQPEGTRVVLLASLVRNRKGMFKDLIESLRRGGFTKLRVDGALLDLGEEIALKKSKRHTIDVVIDRVVVRPERPELRRRLRDALTLAQETSEEGLARVEVEPPEGRAWSMDVVAGADGEGPGAHGLSHQHFSFNSPLGMCPGCQGLGTRLEMDAARVIPDPSRALDADAVAPWQWRDRKRSLQPSAALLGAVYEALAIDPSAPYAALDDAQREGLLRGLAKPVTIKARGKRSTQARFEGILAELMHHFREGTEAQRDHLAQYVVERACAECGGTRLRAESRAVKLGGASIDEVAALAIDGALAFFEGLALAAGKAATIGGELVPEITRRLRFLDDVGLSYLQLDRAGPTLSGGESQRIRLATQLGSGLTGVLYVLDEPSIGLHPRDHRRLLGTLERLRDQGNTILVVEHDSDTMRAADFLVDFGPAAGKHGGELMYAGPGDAVEAASSLTADYLSGRRRIETPAARRPPRGQLRVRGARHNNLRDLDVDVPLGVFVCVTGVSGAGKSTLVGDILLPAARNAALGTQHSVGDCDGVDGLEALDRVIAIDQKPIGRTPRSNPATYTKVFDHIRSLFASLPDSQVYGYAPGRFSFNVKGGRCEVCKGAGMRTLEMQFLSDVYVPCEVCQGARFNEATLRVRYRGLSISDVLALNVSEALELFTAHPPIHRILQTLEDVGLGYIQLGQPSPTLSGGEAQRVKLSRELARAQRGHTLYVLDEPSTGLHFEDIRHLLGVIDRLVDAHNTVVVIEHNLDIIRYADHLIDLGPEGGAAGGGLVAAGPPEAIAATSGSHTGRFLAEALAEAAS